MLLIFTATILVLTLTEVPRPSVLTVLAGGQSSRCHESPVCLQTEDSTAYLTRGSKGVSASLLSREKFAFLVDVVISLLGSESGLLFLFGLAYISNSS